MEPTEMKHYLLLPKLASSCWTDSIKYLKGESVDWNHNLCTSFHFSYQSSLWILFCCSLFYSLFFFFPQEYPLGILIYPLLQYTLHGHWPTIHGNDRVNSWKKVFSHNPNTNMSPELLSPREKGKWVWRVIHYCPYLNPALTLCNPTWNLS